jgi:hypothetical protein
LLPTEAYLEQVKRWPTSGRHILAHHDDRSIVVYQAYRPSIARYALENGRFGGPDFSFARMSWVKPNFLWMMYRSAWGSSEGQEAVLGLRLSRVFFDELLRAAVASSEPQGSRESRSEWQRKLARSEVRLQWDPDHDPSGRKLLRRAIQLGLRGEMLRAYATTELLEVIDISPFAAAQRRHLNGTALSDLQTPVEHVYRPSDVEAAANVELDP